jgi:hypothetical protein
MKTKASLWIAVFSTVGALAAAPGTLAAEKDMEWQKTKAE